MNSDTQLKVQAYLDNELSSGDARKVAGLISSDREVQDLYNGLRATRQILRDNEPEPKLDQSREFYWSKIQRQIESAERKPAPRQASPFWIRLLAPVLGTAALFALLLTVLNPGTTVRTSLSAAEAVASRPLHGEVEDLAPDVSSVTFRSEEAGVTVVWLTSRE
jgi:anti-sigma factor RsiW